MTVVPQILSSWLTCVGHAYPFLRGRSPPCEFVRCEILMTRKPFDQVLLTVPPSVLYSVRTRGGEPGPVRAPRPWDGARARRARTSAPGKENFKLVSWGQWANFIACARVSCGSEGAPGAVCAERRFLQLLCPECASARRTIAGRLLAVRCSAYPAMQAQQECKGKLDTVCALVG